MCFQRFKHYACGHIDLEEDECDQAFGQVFYIKVACSAYQIERVEVNNPCGIGGYYCRQTRDGAFLDGIYRELKGAGQQFQLIQTRIKTHMGLWQRLHAQGEESSVPMEDRWKHPSYKSIVSTLMELTRRRNELLEVRARCFTTLQQAMEFYGMRAVQTLHARGEDFTQYANNTRGNTMVTAGTIDVGARDLQQGFQGAISNFTSTDSRRGDYSALSPLRLKDSKPPLDVATSFGKIHPPQTADSTTVPSYPQRKRGRPPKRKVIHEDDSHEQHAAVRKEAPPTKPSLQRESSSLRRSTRVRDKKVSYAESEGSSFQSREASPEKSDRSWRELSGSPAKSEASLKRERQEVRMEADDLNAIHVNSGKRSLGSKIAEWQQHSSRAHHESAANQMRSNYGEAQDTSAQQPLQRWNTALPPHISSIAPSLHWPSGGLASTITYNSQVPHAISNMRPPTRRGPPTQPPFASNQGPALPPSVPNFFPTPTLPSQDTPPHLRLNPQDFPLTGGYGNPQQFQPSGSTTQGAQPAPSQDWLINTPAFNTFTESTAFQNSGEKIVQTGELMERIDSMLPGMSGGTIADQQPVPAPDFNYDRMRRSFGANTDLTPPAGDMGASKANTDPKKRPLPASSPGPLSRKRIRLSLPGDNNIPSRDDVASMSSPSKMLSYPTSLSLAMQQQAVQPGLEQQPTPAPIFPPTAVMYMPIQHSTAVVAPGGQGEEVEESGEQDIDDYDVGNMSADIDWGDLINDEGVEM